jgi:predicted GNAT family acetyltransferase
MHTTEFTITNNPGKQRFEAAGGEAMLDYQLCNGGIALIHTCVPEKFSGRGLGSALATYAFGYAKENNLTVIVYCPFVKHFIEKYPQYQPQVAQRLRREPETPQ